MTSFLSARLRLERKIPSTIFRAMRAIIDLAWGPRQAASGLGGPSRRLECGSGPGFGRFVRIRRFLRRFGDAGALCCRLAALENRGGDGEGVIVVDRRCWSS